MPALPINGNAKAHDKHEPYVQVIAGTYKSTTQSGISMMMATCTPPVQQTYHMDPVGGAYVVLLAEDELVRFCC